MNSQLIQAITNQASLEEIQVLINSCQDINEVEMDIDKTPLMATIISHPRAIPLLMTHPQLDVNKTNQEDKTALFYAFRSEPLAISLLMAHPQLDVNKTNLYGQTVLMLATNFRVDLSPFLTHPNIDVNVQDNKGGTALHWATSFGVDLSPFLTHPNIDVNAQDDFGNTALHCAVYVNEPSALNQLLAFSQTDLSLRNNDGYIAMYLAKRWKPDFLPLFRCEILMFMSPRVVPRLGGTSLTRLPMDIIFLLIKMLGV